MGVFMSNNYKIISIDESGKASYSHPSKFFVLSAVIIAENFKPKLDKKIRKLKKKYFANEEIIFHSRDMSRKKGLFSVLNSKNTEVNFWSEFVTILNSDEIAFIFIISDKIKAKKLGWESKTILKRSYSRLLELFLIQLTKDKNKGKIVVESDPSQDFFLIEAHNSLQTQNQNYRDNITSLSLVNKLNLDPDVQIADSTAHIAGLLFSKYKPKTQTERVKIRLIERKLLNKDHPSYLESTV